MSARSRVVAFLDAHTSRGWRSGLIALTHDGKANPHALTVDDLRALIDALAEVEALHDAWGNTADELDQLALWEDLGVILAKVTS